MSSKSHVETIEAITFKKLDLYALVSVSSGRTHFGTG